VIRRSVGGRLVLIHVVCWSAVPNLYNSLTFTKRYIYSTPTGFRWMQPHSFGMDFFPSIVRFSIPGHDPLPGCGTCFRLQGKETHPRNVMAFFEIRLHQIDASRWMKLRLTETRFKGTRRPAIQTMKLAQRCSRGTSMSNLPFFTDRPFHPTILAPESGV
jgi:hypothetical protein